jgi:hypothetical protein
MLRIAAILTPHKSEWRNLMTENERWWRVYLVQLHNMWVEHTSRFTYAPPYVAGTLQYVLIEPKKDIEES